MFRPQSAVIATRGLVLLVLVPLVPTKSPSPKAKLSS